MSNTQNPMSNGVSIDLQTPKAKDFIGKSVAEFTEALEKAGYKKASQRLVAIVENGVVSCEAALNFLYPQMYKSLDALDCNYFSQWDKTKNDANAKGFALNNCKKVGNTYFAEMPTAFASAIQEIVHKTSLERLEKAQKELEKV